MTLIYFIQDHGEGAYCIGKETDPTYNPETCLIVPPKPIEGGYTWDNVAKEWILTITSQQAYIRPIRNAELARTDKYMISDYPITQEEREGAIAYRETLRNVPDKLDPAEMKMPPCPPYLDPKP